MLELLRNRRNPAKSNLDRGGLWEGGRAWARRENWSISARGQSFLTSGSRANSLAGFLRRGLALETGEMNGTHGSQKQKKCSVVPTSNSKTPRRLFAWGSCLICIKSRELSRSRYNRHHYYHSSCGWEIVWFMTPRWHKFSRCHKISIFTAMYIIIMSMSITILISSSRWTSQDHATSPWICF